MRHAHADPCSLKHEPHPSCNPDARADQSVPRNRFLPDFIAWHKYKNPSSGPSLM